MYDAVIFDCDGVLVDSEALGIGIELSMLESIGLSYERDAYIARFMGTPIQDWLAGVDADHEARIGGKLPRDFLERMAEEHRQIVEGEQLTAIAGVAEAVSALACAKAVASSSSVRGLGVKLNRTSLYDIFAPHIYSTEAVRNGKPAPDLFLHAAEKLGIAPARCLVIEDSVNGVRAGVAAGMDVWGFTGGGHCSASHGTRLSDAGAAEVMGDWASAHARFAAWS